MRILSPRGQQWLKGVHLLFSCTWTGAGVALLMMNLFLSAEDGMELYGINISMKFIDDFVIVPGALGCFLTGLVYSTFTKWGWFRHRWIVVKWIVTLYGILLGTFFLGPKLNSLPPLSRAGGLGVLTDHAYRTTKHLLYYFGGFQVATLLFVVLISVLKPWKEPAPKVVGSSSE